MENNDINEDFDQILHEYFMKIKILRRSIKKTDNEYGASDAVALENLIDKAIKMIDSVMSKEINLMTIRLMAMKTTLMFEMAKMMSFTHNEDAAIKLLLQCLNNIMFHFTNPFIIYLAMKIINHYAYLHIKHEKYADVVVSLELAGKIYEQYRCGKLKLYFTSGDLFSPFCVIPPKNEKKLEKIVTMNFDMLAHVYSKDMHDNFPECYHNVLDKHYEMLNNDHLKWSANVQNLALHFLKRNRFEEARHHFSAAVHVLYDYEKILKTESHSQTNDNRWQVLNKTYADLAIGWVKYGLHIFTESKKKIVKHIRVDAKQSENLVVNANGSNDADSLQLKQHKHSHHKQSEIGAEFLENIQDSNNINELPKSNPTSEKKLFFKTLDVSYLESQVPAEFITSTTEARVLFHHTHAWLKKLRARLSIQEHPMQYMNAIFDLNELYKLLAFYEESLETEYVLVKLRVDVIETLRQIFHEIRPQHWAVAEPVMLRELTTIQLELMELNVRRLYAIHGTSVDVNDSKFDGILRTMSDLQSKLHQLNIQSSNVEDPPSII